MSRSQTSPKVSRCRRNTPARSIRTEDHGRIRASSACRITLDQRSISGKYRYDHWQRTPSLFPDLVITVRLEGGRGLSLAVWPKDFDGHRLVRRKTTQAKDNPLVVRRKIAGAA